MRVFVAGASGAVGTRLVARLVENGHEVTGTYKTEGSADVVRSLGAEPVALDLLDSAAVRKAVLEAKPDAIVHEATALKGRFDFRRIGSYFEQTNLIRVRGTDALLAAAKEAGVGRFVAQSYASYRYARTGGFVKTEDDPLDPQPPPELRGIYEAMDHLDEAVTGFGGAALRYGQLYGDSGNALVEAVRKRAFPLVGDAGAYVSFVHLDDAAAATVLALEKGAAGVYNVVDDEPAPARDWMPYLARVVGAKPPRHYPAWAARMFAGPLAVMMGTETRGASNAKAKRELGWTLAYSSWRQGFIAAYGARGLVGDGN